MENAITNLGMDPKQFDMQMLIHEADKRGNNQIGWFKVREFYQKLLLKANFQISLFFGKKLYSQ
jgi:hypothetical protein